MSGQSRSAIRVGTVGYHYRDWYGLFYPKMMPARKQLQTYASQFDVCELPQYAYQMPEAERMARLAAEVKPPFQFLVRLHNTFTHCTDIGLALTIASHFKRAIQPLADAGKLGGFVAQFPYAFKFSNVSRGYLTQLKAAFAFDGVGFEADFRHHSWFTADAVSWAKTNGVAIVCVDEPDLPGLVPPLSLATADRVLVRLHGRNREGWWSGNTASRFDYLYSEAELNELLARYQPLVESGTSVDFVFQNCWQAQAVHNAAQFRAKLSAIRTPQVSVGNPEPQLQDEDGARPRVALSLAEVKSRVSQALAEPAQQQTSLYLPEVSDFSDGL